MEASGGSSPARHSPLAVQRRNHRRHTRLHGSPAVPGGQVVDHQLQLVGECCLVGEARQHDLAEVCEVVPLLVGVDQCFKGDSPFGTIAQIGHEDGRRRRISMPGHGGKHGEGEPRVVLCMRVGVGAQCAFQRRKRKVDVQGELRIIVRAVFELAIEAWVTEDAGEQEWCDHRRVSLKRRQHTGTATAL